MDTEASIPGHKLFLGVQNVIDPYSFGHKTIKG
jgi:hypothetical protein